MKNYYEILGVSRDASQEEIKKAYRALAKKYHPDEKGNRNDQEANRIFQEITEAYQVLSDPKAREQYNTWGHQAYRDYASRTGRTSHSHAHGHGGEEGHCGACGGHDGAEGHCGACGGHDGEDGHCGACGEHAKKQKEKGPAPGSVRTAVYLTYQEVLTGAEKEVEISYREPCPWCSGKIDRELKDKKRKCPHCWDRGYIRKTRMVKIKLPPRCYKGQFFLLKDVLCEGEKVDQKNIVVIVLLREQEGYERRDYHLFSVKKVSYVDMVLGGEIEIPTIEGTVTYRLKPGTQSGSQIRLTGKGLWMPPKVGNRGNQYVTLQVEIPKKLTEAQEKALRAFGDTMRTNI